MGPEFWASCLCRGGSFERDTERFPQRGRLLASGSLRDRVAGGGGGRKNVPKHPCLSSTPKNPSYLSASPRQALRSLPQAERRHETSPLRPERLRVARTRGECGRCIDGGPNATVFFFFFPPQSQFSEFWRHTSWRLASSSWGCCG